MATALSKQRNAGETFRIELETPEGLASFDCGAEEYVFDAAARNGTVLPSICLQGRCLTCACKLLSGEVDQSDAATYYPEDLEAGFVLPCRLKPRSNLLLKTHQAEQMREQRIANGLPAPYT